MDKIEMVHGAGGKQMHDLINQIIKPSLHNNFLRQSDDCAILPNKTNSSIAMTTDSYVVSPLFFPGGDIGKLAVCGTVNDLATSGATAKWLSLSFIIEEGFPIDDLKKIISSIAKTSKEAEIEIVTGDTKVVEKTKGDGIYINSCGIGFIPEGVKLSSNSCIPGDTVILSGPVGNHESALILARKVLNFESTIKSDVCPLNLKISQLLEKERSIRAIKDPTRGGLASALSEIAENSRCEIIIDENHIPVDKDVRALCDLSGFDPLYMANEGKLIFVCEEKAYKGILNIFPHAKKIGTISNKNNGPNLLLRTKIGGLRKITMLETLQFPRIC